MAINDPSSPPRAEQPSPIATIHGCRRTGDAVVTVCRAGRIHRHRVHPAPLRAPAQVDRHSRRAPLAHFWLVGPQFDYRFALGGTDMSLSHRPEHAHRPCQIDNAAVLLVLDMTFDGRESVQCSLRGPARRHTLHALCTRPPTARPSSAVAGGASIYRTVTIDGAHPRPSGADTSNTLTFGSGLRPVTAVRPRGRAVRCLDATQARRVRLLPGTPSMRLMCACSSTGRAAVSKTAGWGFESLRACHRFTKGSV